MNDKINEDALSEELNKQLVVFARSFLNNHQISLQMQGEGNHKNNTGSKNHNISITYTNQDCFVVDGFQDNLITQTKGAIDEAAAKIKLCDNALLRSYNFLSSSDFEILKIFENWRTNQILFKSFAGCKKGVLSYKQFCLQHKTINKLEAVLYDLKSDFNNVHILDFKNQMQNNWKILNNQGQFLQACHKLIQSLTKSSSIDDEAGSKTQQSQINEANDTASQNNDDNIDSHIQQQQQNEKWDDDMSAIVDFIKNHAHGTKQIKQDSDGMQNVSTPNQEAFKVGVKDFKYQVFTKNFDKIAKITQLTTKSDKHLKDTLKLDVKNQIKMQNKDIKNLIKKLSGIAKINYTYDTEDGLLDKRKLKDLILQKSDGNIFFRRNEIKKTDVAITVLVDNSGSMRGRLIKISAMACYLLAKVLSQFNINFEVLGFTTQHWQGGDSFESYNKLNNELKKQHPGRVSDILHIIYKSFSQNNSANAIANIALMQKDSLLKENIDGEALQWAYKRLVAQKQKKKILIVISDGTPIDDATIALNGKDYLINHLVGVVDDIYNQKKADLIAIGIMHDVTKFYKNAIKINSVDDLSHTLFNGICNAL